MKIWKKIILIVASVIFAGAMPLRASALESGDVVMSLNPASQSLELEAGKTTDASLKVSNLGRLAFDVNVSTSPYFVANDNYDPDFVSETSQTKLFGWIKLEKEKYHIEPGETAEVKFSVTVPSDTPAGGQYAAIMLAADSGDKDSGSMSISSRLAAILYGHVNGVDLRTEGELVDHTLPGFITDGNFSLSQSIKNTGNVDFRVTQTMTVTDFFSNREVVSPESVDTDQQMFAYSSSTVLPNTTRTGILTWKSAPKLGLFTVTQRIAFLDQDLTFTRLVFICPIWLVVIFIALVIAIIVVIILKILGKRKQKKSLKLARAEKNLEVPHSDFSRDDKGSQKD